MKRFWIEYQTTEPVLPMTFWVHRATDGEQIWRVAEGFSPPRQEPIPGRGYPVFHVEFDGFTFVFASIEEIEECVATLSQKLLPRSLDLSRKREVASGPNSHWLSKLPSKVKSWRYREKAVPVLLQALAHFKSELA